MAPTGSPFGSGPGRPACWRSTSATTVRREFSFDRSTFGAIEVFTLNGADQFRVDQANGAFADETLTVDGGRGDDVLNGGDGAERFLGQNGDDSVDGNRGNDTGILGSGDDSFRWDPGDGSDVVEGERGFDTLDFNGAGVDEIMSLSANGERSLFLRNVANIRMDMGGVERLDLTTLGGIDTFTLDDMSGTDFREAQVDLSGPAGGPDGAADVVTVNGTAGADSIQVGVPGVTDVDVPVVGLQTELLILGSEVADRPGDQDPRRQRHRERRRRHPVAHHAGRRPGRRPGLTTRAGGPPPVAARLNRGLTPPEAPIRRVRTPPIIPVT